MILEYNTSRNIILEIQRKNGMNMEIEKKYLIRSLPDDLKSFPHDQISQAYISTSPVIRIRRKNDSYILTVKSSGLMAREEAEFDISQESFSRLLTKTEGNIIEKTRYKIPHKDSLTIELDLFHGVYEGFIMAEVEFASLDQALAYQAPEWFDREVTEDPSFHNSYLSGLDQEGIRDFLNSYAEPK